MLLVAAVALAGCSNAELKTIEEVAYSYSHAMANYDVDGAEPYATDETKSTTLIKARQLMQLVGDEYIASDTPAEIKIVDAQMTSDTTAYAVYHKTSPIKDFTDTLRLRKRNDVWQAHAPIPKIKPTSPSDSQS